MANFLQWHCSYKCKSSTIAFHSSTVLSYYSTIIVVTSTSTCSDQHGLCFYGLPCSIHRFCVIVLFSYQYKGNLFEGTVLFITHTRYVRHCPGVSYIITSIQQYSGEQSIHSGRARVPHLYDFVSSAPGSDWLLGLRPIGFASNPQNT